MTQAIPSPPSVPFLGHTASIDKEVPIASLDLLAKQYGEIFELNMLGESDHDLRCSSLLTCLSGTKTVVINSQELLHEVSDETRFRKVLTSGLYEVRNAVGDGLFTVDIPFLTVY